jgi:hypothetical protein
MLLLLTSVKQHMLMLKSILISGRQPGKLKSSQAVMAAFIILFIAQQGLSVINNDFTLMSFDLLILS